MAHGKLDNIKEICVKGNEMLICIQYDLNNSDSFFLGEIEMFG